MNRIRLNIFLDSAHALQLTELAHMRGESRSAIVAAALRAYLAPDNGDARDRAIATHLIRLSQQFSRLQRDQLILTETLALSVRYAMSVAAPLPEALQEAGRVQGRVRFQQFIRQLAKQLQSGNSLAKEIEQEHSRSESAAEIENNELSADATAEKTP